MIFRIICVLISCLLHMWRIAHGAETDLWPKPVKVAEAKTAICQCGGSNKGVCFCLKKGLPCKCSANVGSIWYLDQMGKAVAKTGQYANPKTVSAALKLVPEPTKAAVHAQPQLKQLPVFQPQYQTICNGRFCRRVRVR